MEVVETNDGSLSLAHGDHGEWFHSKDGAKLEAYDLYIAGSGLYSSFETSGVVRILDVGLGLGYNACATIDSWWNHPNPCDLELVSLEYDEKLISLLKSGNAPWQTNWPPAWKSWCVNPQITHPNGSSHLQWSILDGDGRESIRTLSGPWDFIWQDPFSPSQGCELWDQSWFQSLHKQSSEGCKLMTYSVARVVRDALEQARWTIEKIPTTTTKKHWLAATKSSVPSEDFFSK